jgi:hypothetical protein
VRVLAGACLLAPGALTVLLSFRAGGFFPAATGVVTCGLLAALVGYLMLARELSPVSAPLGAALAALAGYAVWSLLSCTWSDAPGRALLEFQRALLYLAALALFGLLPGGRARLAWAVRGLVLGASVVCAVALLSRLRPDLVATTPALAAERLSYPLSYWNGLGILAAVGALLAIHLTSSEREPAAVRVLASPLVVLQVVTAFFTFSRGAMAAGCVGLVLYAVLGRPRALLSGLAAAGGASAVAILAAYRADELASAAPDPAPALAQGRDLLLVVVAAMLGAGLARLALLPADARLGRIRPRRVPGRLRTGLAVVAVLMIGLLGVPGFLGHQYDRFVAGDSVRVGSDFRARLTQPGNQHRLEQWRVALDEFERSPLRGSGAGTYQLAWEQQRPSATVVVNAHSLYLEVLGELGALGLALLLVVLLAVLRAFLAVLRGEDRHLGAALLAAGGAWALHAGVDWDWQLPAVTLWLFALGGLALYRGPPRPVAAPRRLLVAAQLLVLAAVPGAIAVAAGHTDRAADAFARHDCPAVVREGQAAIDTVGVLVAPHELVGFCRLQQGQPHAAIAGLRRAIALDPGNWNLWYDLTLAHAAAGIDPRPAARRTLALNPRDSLARYTVRRLAHGNAAGWRRWARELAARFTSL